MCVISRLFSLGITVRMPFYAVARGRRVGIFLSWSECQTQVHQFKNPIFKKFATQTEAENFIIAKGGELSVTKSTPSGSNLKLISDKNSNLSKEEKEEIAASKEFIRLLEEELEEASGKNLPTKSNKRAATNIACGKSAKSAKKNISFPSIIPEGVKMSRYGGNDYHVDGDGYVQVYTDGSCQGNGQAGAQAGLGVYWDENHALNTSKPVEGRATNNCGEIQASTEAVRTAGREGIDKLCINTDSKFLIQSATEWMPRWKNNGWKTAQGQPVKNESDFKALDHAIRQSNVNVKWNYVPAHQGVLGNERADHLARKGGEKFHRKY